MLIAWNLSIKFETKIFSKHLVVEKAKYFDVNIVNLRSVHWILSLSHITQTHLHSIYKYWIAFLYMQFYNHYQQQICVTLHLQTNQYTHKIKPYYTMEWMRYVCYVGDHIAKKGNTTKNKRWTDRKQYQWIECVCFSLKKKNKICC